MGNFGFEAEVWSMGVILYEMCALKPPFVPKEKGASEVQLKNLILKGKYDDIPSGYSKEMHYLIECMLTLNPQDRPTIDNILKFKPVAKVVKDIEADPELKTLYQDLKTQ